MNYELEPYEHEVPDPLDDSEWKKKPPVGPWVADAACADKPADWWFPITTTEDGYDAFTAGQAIAVCRACPVQPDCLRHAIEANEMHGIWGGQTERARARIRKNTLRRTA